MCLVSPHLCSFPLQMCIIKNTPGLQVIWLAQFKNSLLLQNNIPAKKKSTSNVAKRATHPIHVNIPSEKVSVHIFCNLWYFIAVWNWGCLEACTVTGRCYVFNHSRYLTPSHSLNSYSELESLSFLSSHPHHLFIRSLAIMQYRLKSEINFQSHSSLKHPETLASATAIT